MSLVRKGSRKVTVGGGGEFKHFKKNPSTGVPPRKVSSLSATDASNGKQPMLFTQQLLSRKENGSLKAKPALRKRRKRENLQAFKASIKTATNVPVVKEEEKLEEKESSAIPEAESKRTEKKSKTTSSRRKRRSTKSLQAFKKSLSLSSSNLFHFSSKREKHILDVEDTDGGWGGSRSSSIGENMAKIKRKILKPSSRTLTRPKSPKQTVNPILSKDVGELVKSNIVPQIKTSKRKTKRLSKRGLESNNESLNNLFQQNSKKKDNSVQQKKKNLMIYAKKRYNKNNNKSLPKGKRGIVKRRGSAGSAASSVTLEPLLIPGSAEAQEENELTLELSMLRDQYKKIKPHSSSTLKSAGSNSSNGIIEQLPASPVSNLTRSPTTPFSRSKKKSIFSSLFRKKQKSSTRKKPEI